MPLPERRRLRLTAVASLATCLGIVQAAEIDTGTDLKLRVDNTLKYSGAYRLKNPSAKLTSDPNLDDGDASFRRGLVSNRVDWLGELDMAYQNFGLRLSAAGWYDTVYNRSNDYDGNFSNATSVNPNEFTHFARRNHGRDVEFLDAFVFGKFSLADSSLTVRAGRHALIYGETLFFGMNGIAAAQGPVDVVKQLSVPGSQFKELLRPTEQLSANLQLRPNLSVGGYYQFRWHASRLPAPGSYFSNVDFAPDGAESIALAPGVQVPRGPDLQPKDSGQGGLQLRYTPPGSGIDLGVYLARFHDKAPSGIYITPPGLPVPATVGLRHAYHEGIRTAGVSASTSVGDWNVAAEVSVRHNTPLNSNPVVTFGDGDNAGNAQYAVGRSAHINVSGIYALPPSAFWAGGNLLAELAWHRLTSVTRNPVSAATGTGALDPGVTRDATAVRFIFEPSYYQVIDGLDLTVPIGVGYGIDGRSPLFASGFPSRGNGDFSIGLRGTYQQVWQFGLEYVTFIGPEKLTAVNGAQTYGQSLKDRSFVSFNLKRTF